MRRTVLAIVCAAVLPTPACDFVGGQDTAPPSASTSLTTSASRPTTPEVLLPPDNSRPVSVPSGSTPAQLRHKTCEDLLPRFESVRKTSGQSGVDQAADAAIANFTDTPDWPVLSEPQHHAVIDGARDAATGSCP
ncbi:hypothetical protein ACIA8C_18385 [Nocardia sp. NPDC051321]|uniref:hypothetical protein n=1 Tax=Nocardia sp. NPDC051321 TaxID=3364323 RepID=UPI0037AF47B8